MPSPCPRTSRRRTARTLRLLVAACLALGFALPTSALALGPPTIVEGPDDASTTASTSVRFAVRGEQGTSLWCRIDLEDAAPCGPTAWSSGLSLGRHRFEVFQRSADDVDSDPAVREWTVVAATDPGRPGPPYGSGVRLDGDLACDGGLFDIIVTKRDRYVRCLTAAELPWRRITPAVTVGATAATITITRPDGASPALVGFATAPDTAIAGRDYGETHGDLYFTVGQTTRTISVPIVRDPAVADGRRFRVVLSDGAGLGLQLTDATVTIPSNLPAASTAPTQTGRARVGETLTGGDGSWTGAPDAFRRGWQRCDADGDGCATIDGAADASYVPTAADVGHRLRFAVTATNAAGPTTAASTPTAVVRATLAAPAITVTPPSVTATRTADFGFTGESGASFECRIDDQVFATCTSPTRFSGLRSIGHHFDVRQRGDDGLLSPVASYDWTVLPGPDPVYPDGPPYSDGAPPDGNRLCMGGPFDPVPHDGDSYIRCWDDGGSNGDWRVFTSAVDVAASSATITVRRQSGAGPALVGFATVAGTATEGRDFTATSGELYFAAGRTERTIAVPLRRDPTATADRRFTVALSDPVAIGLRLPGAAVDLPGNPPVVVTPPTVGGVARSGGELTAAAGTWGLDPGALASSWLRCDEHGDGCATIGEATGSRYTATAADVGHRLRFVETASNDAGSTAGRSAATAVVRTALGAPAITAAPDAATEEAAARFVFTGEAGARFACRLDDGAFADCTSPKELTGLRVGEHRFEVRQQADDGIVSSVAGWTWTVAPAPEPPGPGTDPEGSDPPTPTTPMPPPAPGPPERAPAPAPLLPAPPSGPKAPVRMATIRMELRFCAGCARLSVRDQARLRRVRGRVDGARLLAIDGYGDRRRSPPADRRLARARTRAVERLLLAGVRERPARLAVVAHDRPSPTTERKTSDRRVTVRIVVRR